MVELVLELGDDGLQPADLGEEFGVLGVLGGLGEDG